MDELPTVEGESQLWYTLCQVMGAPKGNAGFSENPVFIYLLEHPFFFGERIQRIIQARGWFRDLKGGCGNVALPTRQESNRSRKVIPTPVAVGPVDGSVGSFWTQRNGGLYRVHGWLYKIGIR